MKLSIAVSAIAFSLMASSAPAQSPREQLADLVGRLQTSDNVYMRQAIIRLAAKITPPPAIPEEARRAFVEGMTIVKSAKDSASLTIAIESFKVALKTAPWWSDAYYNLAATQELAGQFDAARLSFQYFIGWFPDGPEAREAQDRLYAIDAKQKLAAAEQDRASRAREQELAALKSTVEGKWYSPAIDFELVKTGQTFTIVPGKFWGVRWIAPYGVVVTEGTEGYDVVVRRVRFASSQPACSACPTLQWNLTLSYDGKLTGPMTDPDGTTGQYVLTRRIP